MKFTPRRMAVLASILIVVGLFIGGIGWVAWWVSDNIGAPGPPPTGSGPCTSADSVNIQLVFADGHTVQACTRDRPPCPNYTVSGSVNGQNQPSVSQFGLGNQLRSSSRRYIFSVSLDAALPAEAAEQTIPIDNRVFMPVPQGPGPSSHGALSAAMIHITPRDPYEDGYSPVSGSVTVSSSHGVARGRIDANFPDLSITRPDRPAPTPTSVSPTRITGTFTCNQ
jgi:hypothetical protein